MPYPARTAIACFFIPIFLLVLRYNVKRFRKIYRWLAEGDISEKAEHKRAAEQKNLLRRSPTKTGARVSETAGLNVWKQFYYHLHNLEDFPEVLPLAQEFTLSLLGETTAQAHALQEDQTILCVERFSREDLKEFMMLHGQGIALKWDQYIARRQKGEPRELFKDRDEAEWWLKQLAPVKYVDGAWLGHINRVTLPYGLLETIRSAWQVLSEELGDGDLKKNHAHIYRELLSSMKVNLPPSYDRDFIHERHRLDELSVWKAAVAQLLICLFPHDLLPEILGFNLHFEEVSLETLMATKELREVGLDPNYFVLHVSIDNGHSGHTAMATEIVCRYLEHTRFVEGEAAAQRAWKRVQAGYLLSSGLSSTTICPPKSKASESVAVVALNVAESETIKIFRDKAQVGHLIHCGSRSKIGRRKLVDWLDPVALQSKQWQMNLLDDLSNSRVWVRKGDSSKSRFVQELEWGGVMFGSFTGDECDVVKRWIDKLSMYDGEDSILAPCLRTDIISEYPVLRKPSTLELTDESHDSSTKSINVDTLEPFPMDGDPIPERFLPLWLSHTCLLANLVSVPYRTTNIGACAVVKILRAQAGFGVERSCVAGMDEVWRPSSLGIIGLGMVMMKQWRKHEPVSLKEVLVMWPSDFATEMLHLSMRPVKNKGLLIGMTTAFVKFHTAMSRSKMLSTENQDLLGHISQREEEELQICWSDLESDQTQYKKCGIGYSLARREILRCFPKSSTG